MDEITTEENDLLPKLKPYEIYLFNLWLFFALLIFICLFVVIMPEDFISDYFGIIFPAKYWFIAVPTHILTTLLGLTICIKGFELIYTLDEPPIKDFYYHELSEEEMMKEINYNPEEGILPDAGDINYNIVQEISNMDNESNENTTDNYDNDKEKNNNSEA